jgi:hypothetical protein
VPANLAVRLYCDPNGSSNAFDVKADPSTCTYTFIFAVPQGCPKAKSSADVIIVN